MHMFFSDLSVVSSSLEPLVQCLLITFYRQQIVGFFSNNLCSYFLLATQCINGYQASFDAQ